MRHSANGKMRREGHAPGASEGRENARLGWLTLRALLTWHGVAALVIGAPSLLAPGVLLSILGIPGGAGARFALQLYGASHVAICLICWTFWGVGDASVQRLLVRPFLAGILAGFVVTLLALLRGVVNPVGWLMLAVYLALMVGYGAFEFGGR